MRAQRLCGSRRARDVEVVAGAQRRRADGGLPSARADLFLLDISSGAQAASTCADF